MGLSSSKGRDNDDLVDKLVDRNLIVTKEVETAMRLVDRGHFLLPNDKEIAYKDMAWRTQLDGTTKLHLSAPCVYANALEHLELRKGNSFLNIGSGTGFLNTVVGYLIGSTGINHGIEIYESLCNYARQKVEETVKLPQTQCFDWAPPRFSCGNGLSLSPSLVEQYDRVYCGGAVSATYRRSLWELLKIGGILVMPYDDELLQVRRLSKEEFCVTVVSPVSFTDFVLPSSKSVSYTPEIHRITSLQRLCCIVIRQTIRDAVSGNIPLYTRSVVSETPKVRQYVQPVVVLRADMDKGNENNNDDENEIGYLLQAENETDSSEDSDEGADDEEEEIFHRTLYRYMLVQRFSQVLDEVRHRRQHRSGDGAIDTLEPNNEVVVNSNDHSAKESEEKPANISNLHEGNESFNGEVSQVTQRDYTEVEPAGCFEVGETAMEIQDGTVEPSGPDLNSKQLETSLILSPESSCHRYDEVTADMPAINYNCSTSTNRVTGVGIVVDPLFPNDTSSEGKREDDSNDTLSDNTEETSLDEEAEKVQESESSRLLDCKKQQDSLMKFAVEFERRIDALPISKSLIKMVKYFSVYC